MNLFTGTAVLRSRGVVTGVDGYGNDLYGPGSDEPWPAWWEPRTSGEDTAAREQYVSGYWLYLPLGAPLTAADVVVLAGVEYEVVGDPGAQPGGFVVEGYQLAALERVTG